MLPLGAIFELKIRSDPLAGFQRLLHGREGEGREGGTFLHLFFYSLTTGDLHKKV